MPESVMGRKDEATDRRHRVIVYGRLRKGQGAGLLDDSKFLGTVIIPATDMVMLDAMDGAYPVVASAKESGHEPQKIVADLFAVNDETLKALDQLESVPHLFQRQKIKVRNRGQSINANIYVAAKDAFDLEGGKVVKDGDWSSHKRDAQEKEGAQLSRAIKDEVNDKPEYGYHITQNIFLDEIKKGGLLSPSPEPDEQPAETHFTDDLESIEEWKTSSDEIILRFPFPSDAQWVGDHWETRIRIPWSQIKIIEP